MSIDPTQLRNILNSLAIVFGSLSTALVLSDASPVLALAAGSIGAFLSGWANLTKPGDVKVPRGSIVTAVSDEESGTQLIAVTPPAAQPKAADTEPPPTGT
ncbi:MAG TPA: hypothetical protein VFQ61_06345 [Polyangiaceae bacterium]|nr:hypothetical protein [Polyangiaceae bacterium]